MSWSYEPSQPVFTGFCRGLPPYVASSSSSAIHKLLLAVFAKVGVHRRLFFVVFASSLLCNSRLVPVCGSGGSALKTTQPMTRRANDAGQEEEVKRMLMAANYKGSTLSKYKPAVAKFLLWMDEQKVPHDELEDPSYSRQSCLPLHCTALLEWSRQITSFYIDFCFSCCISALQGKAALCLKDVEWLDEEGACCALSTTCLGSGCCHGLSVASCR